MITQTLRLAFDKSFIEEAVFLTLRHFEEEGKKDLVRAWNTQRDRIYGIEDSEKRERTFEQRYEEMFLKLGLGPRFETIVTSFPILLDALPVLFIRRSLSRKEEGAELFVQGNTRTCVVRIQTIRVLEGDYLKGFLCHELMHISDMLDPAFQYSPHPALGGRSEIEDNLIRDRYRLLWDLYVSSRLSEKGISLFVSLEQQRKLFDRAFSKWLPDAREKLFQDIRYRFPWTQADLLQFARDENLTVSLGRGGLLCPLCGFSSFEPMDLSSERDAAIVREIQGNHPDWNPDSGICRQCFDLYQSRTRIAS